MRSAIKPLVSTKNRPKTHVLPMYSTTLNKNQVRHLNKVSKMEQLHTALRANVIPCGSFSSIASTRVLQLCSGDFSKVFFSVLCINTVIEASEVCLTLEMRSFALFVSIAARTDSLLICLRKQGESSFMSDYIRSRR